LRLERQGVLDLSVLQLLPRESSRFVFRAGPREC